MQRRDPDPSVVPAIKSVGPISGPELDLALGGGVGGGAVVEEPDPARAEIERARAEIERTRTDMSETVDPSRRGSLRITSKSRQRTGLRRPR